MNRELTIAISDDDARFIDEQVKAGVYESADAVVKAAIDRVRRFDDDATEAAWIAQKVQQALEDQRPPVPADEAFARVRAHLARRGP